LNVAAGAGFRTVTEFTERAWRSSPGDRPGAIRAAATEFRRRFRSGGYVRAVRTIDVVAASVPAGLAIGALPPVLRTWVALVTRMLVVHFDDFDGRRRTLIWEPMRAESIAQLPLVVRSGSRRRAGIPRAPRALTTLPHAFARAGLEDRIDLVSSGDLRGYDLRSLLGTTRPTASEHEPRPAMLAGGHYLIRRAELESVRSPHPLLAPWYVPGGVSDLDDDRLVVLDQDLELGPGVALLSSPGLTKGHQSLVLNLPDGIWVVSSNAVASDCWQPLLSKLPGVRRSAERDGREVSVSANVAANALDLYDAMVLERSLADTSAIDPRWLAILPTHELAAWRRQWPAVPTFSHGRLNYGPQS
jgi:hypothetical protein